MRDEELNTLRETGEGLHNRPDRVIADVHSADAVRLCVKMRR